MVARCNGGVTNLSAGRACSQPSWGPNGRRVKQKKTKPVNAGGRKMVTDGEINRDVWGGCGCPSTDERGGEDAHERVGGRENSTPSREGSSRSNRLATSKWEEKAIRL